MLHDRSRTAQDIALPLPYELWVHIFSYLTYQDLRQARGVCGLWNDIVMQEDMVPEINRRIKQRKEEETARKQLRCTRCGGCLLMTFAPYGIALWYLHDTPEETNTWLIHLVGCLLCCGTPCLFTCYACAFYYLIKDGI